MTAPLLAARYRLMHLLGEGGMGRVWFGHDKVLHRDVAIKEVALPPGLTTAERDELNLRTLREARAAARLNHPNVVRVYDLVRAEPHSWIVMEYVPSRSLHQVISEDGPLPPGRVAEIGLGVLAALTAAHRVGVQHRDVKPGNVLLTDDGRVVLTDFGLATVAGEAQVTRSGLILGSPAYISPERARDGTAGLESDMWSLGATLYAAAEGQSPYTRSTAIATLTALATEEPPAPSHGGPLRTLLEGLLRKDPARRIGTAEAERLLRQAAATPPDQVTPPAESGQPGPGAPSGPRRDVPTARLPSEAPGPAGLPGGGRRRWPVVAAVAAALVVIVLTFLVARANGRGAPATTPGQPAGTAAPSRTGPSAIGTPAAPAVQLPAGWQLYRDPTGFTVPVPTGWVQTNEGTIVYFHEPNGSRLLGIDQTDQPQPDPAGDWARQEAQRASTAYPGYQRIAITPVDYWLASADWEFTYDEGGMRVHVINRGVVTSNHQAYGIWWSVPDSAWADNLGSFQLITSRFQPRP